MGRILTTLLSVYWTCIFAQDAITRLLPGSSTPFALQVSGGSIGVAVGLGSALVATLFVWLLITAVLDVGVCPSGADEVSVLAFGGAVAMATIWLASGPVSSAAETTLLPGLLASYVAIHVERRTWLRLPEEQASIDINAAARLMALGAAHNSLLSRLATTRPMPNVRLESPEER